MFCIDTSSLTSVSEILQLTHASVFLCLFHLTLDMSKVRLFLSDHSGLLTCFKLSPLLLKYTQQGHSAESPLVVTSRGSVSELECDSPGSAFHPLLGRRKMFVLS